MHERSEHVCREGLADPGIALTDSTSADEIPAWDPLRNPVLLFDLGQEPGVEFAGNEVACLSSVGDLKTLSKEKGVEWS